MNRSPLLRLLLLALLLMSLAGVSAVMAQDAETPAAAEDPVDDTVEAGDEGVVAEESEAQEVGGEEAGIVDDDLEAGVEEEAEAAGSPLAALGINTGFLIAQIVNFLIIFLILRFALWGPLVNMLDSRRAKIEKGLEDAAAAANARRNAETEADKILAQARSEAAQVVEEARARGEEVARALEAEARTEADRIRAEGRTRANEERDRQLADLRGQVAAIAMAVAQRLIGESLDEKRQQALVNDFFAKVPADARSLTGNVEVVSAMPLNDEEKARVQREVGATNVTFTVDPSILGGLIVRSDDRVVDGSVRSGLNDLAGRLR